MLSSNSAAVTTIICLLPSGRGSCVLSGTVGEFVKGDKSTGRLLLLEQAPRIVDPIWAAAGSPRHVFKTTAEELRRITGATVAAVRAG